MRGIAAIGLLLATSLLVGCSEDGNDEEPPKENGIATMSVKEAFAAADEAMSKLTDATYKGTRGTLQLVVAFGRGGECQWTFRKKDVSYTVRQLRRAVYVQFDAEAAARRFGNSEIVKRMAGKWVRGAGDQDLEYCDLSRLVPRKRLWSTFSAGGIDTINGRDAREFTAGKRSLWIATTGAPVVLQLRGSDGSESDRLATLTVTLFDTGLDLQPPRPADMAPLP